MTSTATAVHLLFLPDRAASRWFAWGTQPAALPWRVKLRPERVRCFTDKQKIQTVSGVAVDLVEGLAQLAMLTTEQLERLPGSVTVWSLAAKLALDLVARGRIVPCVDATADATLASCSVSLAMPEDAQRFAQLHRAFPLAAHALAITPARRAAAPPRRRQARSGTIGRELEIWAADALLERFLNAAADALVRRAMRAPNARRTTRQQSSASWEQRLLSALGGKDASFTATGFSERTLLEDLRSWTAPLTGAQCGEARLCLRLELPQTEHKLEDDSSRARFKLSFLLQAAHDPSLLIEAADIYAGGGPQLRRIARDVRFAQERLLTGLATAARVFAPIQASLNEARPTQISLPASLAWDFLRTAAAQLIEAGLGVILPAQLTQSGQRRLRMRMRIGSDARDSASTADGSGAALALHDLLTFHWQAELAGEVLNEKELRELAALKAPLVQHRGQWVAVDASEIMEALRLLEQRDGVLTGAEALAATLGSGGRPRVTSLPVEVSAEGSFGDVLDRLRAVSDAGINVPTTLQGVLRPYQLRGLAWLASMADLGFGACLADDMGLGKTVQLIALLLHRRQQQAAQKPVLLVCPTSVVGNWERELQRFAPSLPVVRHYGADRSRSESAFTALPAGAIVLTTYGLLRRDAPALAGLPWSVVALDEAQNIKTTASRTAQAARMLRADFRVALTGTPVENRLTELWSIFEFLNPRLLGSMAGFRREYAIPIERYGQADAAARLKHIVQPFILRRLKSDRSVIDDLPGKQEMTVICSLTREQASLYQAALDESMCAVEAASGIERRGRVLALITALKQICNHPAHYLSESGPLPGRSGKLQRCSEMLEEVIAGGDRALVFTQYREMGQRLVTEFERVLGVHIPFLHGAVPRAARDEMVKKFQDGAQSSPVLVLSLKAGGTGLNLTAANHVFHFDRWWNPAVEDQATDRAYRIGQHRSVQVHKLLCAGTIEEKVERMLEQKRDLAARIVGAGEQWITEMSDAELRDLFALAPDAVITEDMADDEERVSVVRKAVRPERSRRLRVSA